MKALAYLLLLVASVMCAAAAWAQQGVTPSSGTQIPTLQQAIYSANEGDILYADRYGPRLKEYIRVDRSITLVGGQYEQIEFAGPGHGRALLVGAQVLEDPNPPYGYAYPGILAEGFDLVGVIRSNVRASGSASYGTPNGASALAANYGTSLLLIDSEFYATIGGIVPEYTCAAPHAGSPAVSSSGAPVYALNSAFYGGGGVGNFWDDSVCPSGPYYTTDGAPGLRAHFLLQAGCTFVGGPGAYWLNYPDVGGYGPGWDVWGWVNPWPTHHVR